MRLVALLLTAAAASLPAQAPQVGKGPRSLPWQGGAAPTWQPVEGLPPRPDPTPDASASTASPTGPVTARIAPDGTLEVWNGAGVRTLRLGLPGRPRKVWRDGGRPVTDLDHLAFPAADPLAGGPGGLPWGQSDVRPSLAGLLWILEDGERVLTVVHPATAQAIYLPLPRGEEFDLVFGPSRLLIQAAQGPEGHPQAWALPWLALLPQFARLGPPSVPPPQGTALKPFP
ncbi:MAG TPA: hypothetical protein VFT46_11740 [Holophagaceae bacterium]|nr:hypothetical protein [Holophagaceae bacterium]